MKRFRPLRSKVIACVVCLILTVAMFAPCFPLANKLAHAAQLQTQSQGNFGPPREGLPGLNRARESNSEPSRAAEGAHSPEPVSAADRAIVADPSASDLSRSAEPRSDTSAVGTMNPTGQTAPNAITSFTDVPPTSFYYSQIEIIKNLQVTLGCTADHTQYCPDAPVTREQMSAFILRSLGEFSPPTPPTQRFADVPQSNVFYNFIDRLAVLGITVGCGVDSMQHPIYCPGDNVTRGQMVTFLERAVGRGSPPVPAQQRFVDVPVNHTFYAQIESFVQHGMARGAMNVFMRGCTNGCGLDGQHFLPDQALTRAEMAALLVIEFGWMDGYTSNARLDPINRTGQSGEDLFSGNCNWSVPLLGLPGRAGLDLGLSLSYNSLGWTKVSPAMIFNADNGFSPGFRLGFPVIQTKYSNSQAGGDAYMMVTPSGTRVELRRVGSTNEYDSADSSYLRLDDNTSTLLLRTTDGTQLTYAPSSSPVNGSRSGDYRCAQIKDRNGNFLTINYHPSFGYIANVVDTLSRTVTFNYDNSARLTSIIQTWNGANHTWATFGYSSLTINTNFCDPALGTCSPNVSNMSVCGPPNGGIITVLSQVNLDNGLRYNFDYTTWGQVYTVHRTTQNTNAPVTFGDLAYAQFDLPLNQNSQQSDCPRFTTRTDYALNWSTVSIAFIFDRGTGFGKITSPDSTVTKETHASSGFNKGLTTQTDTYSSDNLSTPKRTVTMSWTQDNTGVSYPLNPRVIETNTTDDASNHRRATISYSSLTLPPNSTICSLPSDVREYNLAGTAVLRKTHTDYDTSLLGQRIIGLPSARYLYDTDTQGATPLSKVTYGYDASGSLTNQGEPVQHDSSYGTGFTTRGNSTSLSRWDVTTLGGQSPQSVTSTIRYNTAGGLISTTDPANHQTTFTYTDSFATTGTTLPSSTLAYPTTMTNADSKSTIKKYDYDIGGERLTTDPKGATRSTTYDGAGRTSRVDISNGAYTRFEYPSTLIQVNTYTLIQTVQTGGVEFFSTQVLDGVGRVQATASDFPGSSGLYRGQYTVYDVMGRVSQQSNTTEMNSNWTPTGDDAQSGWLYTQQTYDWKGRPRITTNTDTTTRSVTYGGCGCAGGEVVTNQDEVSRQQRMTYDVLGRLVKTESLNLDQNHTVYATRTDTYDARDQITNILVQQGTNGTGQQTLMTYDGHGRLSNRKTPIEDTAGTSYLYNADDTVQKVTDARSASSTYTYNGRHLITLIHYAKPGSSAPTVIPNAPDVSFTYDDAGNRQTMSDGLGTMTYVYDTWSRLTSETRFFTDLGASYQLRYEYNLAGGLTKIYDPYNGTISYAIASSGQVTGVTGTNYAGVTTFTSGMQYRAWGALKHSSYFNNGSLDIKYNGRLQMTRYGASASDNQYYADGRVKFASSNESSNTFDRAYSYDQVGRMTQALTGKEARGESGVDGPYKQSYGYDVWDNMTSRNNRFWTQPDDLFTGTYVNGRNSSWTYNASGNITQDTLHHVYNSAGQQTSTDDLIGVMSIAQDYDGDGHAVKRVEDRPSLTAAITTYYLRSSVLGGQVVTEVITTGFRAGTHNTHIYANGSEMALYDSWVNVVRGKLSNPVTGSGWQEIDPLGGYVGFVDPFVQNPNTTYDSLHTNEALYLEDGNPFDPGGGCTLDGLPVSCDYAAGRVAAGAAAVAPLRDVILVWYNGQLTLAFFQAFPDGYQGYVPGNATYAGGGRISSIGPSPPTMIRGQIREASRARSIQGAAEFDALRSLNGVSQKDPEIVLARSSAFMKEGPLWNNAKLEVRGRLEDIVRQLLSSGDCVYWFEGQANKVGYPAKLPDLFKTTGLNFYLSADSVSLGSLPTKPTPLNTSAFGVRGDAIAQTLGRGTSDVQIVFNRSSFDAFSNARLAEELIHEMFHAAGLRGSDPKGPGFLGWRRANDLNPEVQWDDIQMHCGQYIK